MENNNRQGKSKMQIVLERNPEKFQKELEDSLGRLVDLYAERDKKEFTSDIISRIKGYGKTLHSLNIPQVSKYDDIRKVVSDSLHVLNLLKGYLMEKDEGSILKSIQPIGEHLGIGGDVLYNDGQSREIKMEGRDEDIKSSLDPQPLEDMISYLKMLGFEDADTISFIYKSKKMDGCGSKVNEIALGVIDAKSNKENFTKDKIKELEGSVRGLCMEIGNDSLSGNVDYKGKSINYHEFFPKVGEFLKNEVKKLKRKSINNENSVKFSNILGRFGFDNGFDIIECNGFSKYILFEYYRVMKEIVKFKSNLKGVDLKNLHREEIPMIQGTARLNASKMSGSVVYHNREMSINHFSESFGEELKGLIEKVCEDIEVGVSPHTCDMEEILLEDLIEE